MKRFTVATAVFSVSILAVWMAFQASTASSPKTDNRTNSAANQVIVPVTGAEIRHIAPAPVYDASGRILSLNSNGSDNQAVILAPAANVKVAPVYDASGVLKSDPNGTIASTSYRKIAPVFDTTGAVVSDPTGTLLNANNP